MLSYPLPEAETLLSDKLDAAQSNLANCDDDLDFLREQITVSSSLPPFRPQHGPIVDSVYEGSKLTNRRRWKSRPRACTIGTSDSGGKRKQRARARRTRMTRRRVRRMAERSP